MPSPGLPHYAFSTGGGRLNLDTRMAHKPKVSDDPIGETFPIQNITHFRRAVANRRLCGFLRTGERVEISRGQAQQLVASWLENPELNATGIIDTSLGYRERLTIDASHIHRSQK